MDAIILFNLESMKHLNQCSQVIMTSQSITLVLILSKNHGFVKKWKPLDI